MKLIEITPDNHHEARKIKVKEEQDHFVASIQNTLCDAYIFKESVFKLISTEERIVGYTLIYPHDHEGKKRVNIVRLAIDQKDQGKGYGKVALKMIIDWIKKDYPCDVIRISVEPENIVAKTLYIKTGFIEGEIEGKEQALYMEI